MESKQRARDYELILREALRCDPVFVNRVAVDMRFGGMSSRPAAIYRTLREVQHMRGKPRIWTA